MVAGAPAFVMTVVSVILKIRDFSLPAIVKVFAVCSTVEMVPWNGIARTLVVFSAAAGVAFSAGVGFAFGLAAGVGDAAKAAIGAQ
jgi:hypothetical protein